MATEYDKYGRPIQGPVEYDREGRPVPPKRPLMESLFGNPMTGEMGDFGETLTHAFGAGLTDPVGGLGAGTGAVLGNIARGRVHSLNDAGKVYGDAYTAEVNRARSARRRFADERPALATATNIVGGLTSIRGANVGPAAAAARVAPAAERMAAYQSALRAAPVATSRPLATMYAMGGGLGAAYGVANDETGDPMGAALSGGATGLTATAALHGVGATGAGMIDLVRRQGLSPEQRAARLLQREISRTVVTDPKTGQTRQMTLDDIERNRSSLGPGATEETVAEIGGPRLRAAARAVASVPGAGQTIAESTLGTRSEKIADRVMAEAARGMPGANRNMSYEEAVDTLARERAAINRQNYEAGYAETANPETVRMTMEPAMRDGPPEALTSALKQLQAEEFRTQTQIRRAQMGGHNVNEESIDALNAHMERIKAARGELTAIAQGGSASNVSPLAADMYQRGLRQMSQDAGAFTPEGSAWGGGASTFNKLSDQVYPALGHARTEAAIGKNAQEMLEIGGRLLQMTDGEVRMATHGIGATERDALMQGALNHIERKINDNDTAFVARVVRNKNWQNVLRETVGEKAAKRLLTRIRREALMQAFRNYVTGGSRTTPLAEDIRALTEGEAELGFLAEFIESGGQVKNILLRKVAEWWKRQSKNGGINDPAVNKALAEMLYAKATRGAKGGVASFRAQIEALPRYASNDGAQRVGRAAASRAPGLSPYIDQRTRGK